MKARKRERSINARKDFPPLTKQEGDKDAGLEEPSQKQETA